MVKDFYASNKEKKVSDFFIGFFGFFGISAAAGFLISILGSLLYVVYSIQWIVYVAIFAGGIIWANANGRKYIVLGILSTLLIPLLLFGACVILFSGI